MNNFALPIPHAFGTLAATGICLGGIAVLYGLLRRRPSPDETERKRREMLVRQGRIIDATILDISDLSAGESGRPIGLKLILYKYEIAGVVYECSQDVTMLAHLVNIDECRPSFPASVRYDPRNPGNSVIVAETWSGLRQTANSVPVHRPRMAQSGNADSPVPVAGVAPLGAARLGISQSAAAQFATAPIAAPIPAASQPVGESATHSV